MPTTTGKSLHSLLPRNVSMVVVPDYSQNIFNNTTLNCMQICKYDIEQSIEREMSGDLKKSMLTIGQWYTVMYAVVHMFACIYK